MGIFSSKTKVAPPADVITTPQTGYSFVSPYMEDYSRRLLASYFGSPGEYEGLISQPRDIPIEQTAGLTPLQIQARQAAAGLGDFQGSLDRASDLYGKQETALDESMGFVPRAQAGIEEGMGFQREGSELARGAGRLSDAAESMIGTGADTVAGGIGALRRGEETALGSARMFDPTSVSRFMDPYEDQVVQQTLKDINRQAAQADIGLRDRAISQGAFGGSRGRISQEELARETGRGAAEAVSGIRSRGFGQSLGSAQSAFESQQARQAGLGAMQAGLGGQQAAIGAQQAALGGQLAGLGAAQAGLGQQYGQIGQGIAGLGQQGQSQLGTQIGLLNQLGQQGQATQQAALSRQFAGAQQLANEPLQRLLTGQQLLAGSPMGGISGGTGTSAYQRSTAQVPSTASQILGTIGSIFSKSDANLKTNIKKVGELDPGIGWYTWDWNDKAKEIGVDVEPTEGVLAQEVLEVKPDAVIVEDGYYAVDYSKVL